MGIPDLLKPPGTGRTLRCVVEKDGHRSVITAYRTPRDAETDELHFPPHLYQGDGFTLLAMEGEPHFNSLAQSSQAQLDELLSFIAGTGRWSLFGAGMHTYPKGDANDRLKYEMCLELEQQGKIQRHLVTDDKVVWMPIEPKDRK